MSTPEPDNRIILRQLRQRWLFFALFSLAGTLVGAGLLNFVWEPGTGFRWSVLAAPVLVYLLAVLWRALKQNHRPGEIRLLPAFGAGNSLTLLRGLWLAWLAGFLLLPAPVGWLAWAPGVLYTLAVLSDYLDGTLARLTRHVTQLGERLDMSLDGLGVLAAVLLAIRYGQVPAWYLSVALARYLFLAGLWIWRRSGRPVYELAPSPRRRAFAGVQMGLLAVLLLPLFTPPGTHLAAFLFALPFLAGFVIDGLAAAGFSRKSNQALGLTMNGVRRWIPLGLRLAAAALILTPLALAALQVPVPAGLFSPAQAEENGLVLLEAVVLVMLLLGAAGRIASIAGLVLLGFHQIAASLAPAQMLLAAVYTALLYLGTGPLSVWVPENRLIYYRGGENHPYLENVSRVKSPETSFLIPSGEPGEAAPGEV